MQFDAEKIEKAVITEVAQEIMSSDSIWERAKAAVDARINSIFKQTVDEQIKARVEQAIHDGFEREYQKVDSFGVAAGGKTSVRAELEKLIGGYWNCRVDRNGSPTDSSYNTVTRAEWLMTKMCAEDFKGEMQKHVINVGGALKDHFRSELNNMVATLLSEVFHVRSLGDQGLNRQDLSTIKPKAGDVGS